MTCGYCKYEWCWLCGATYSPIHFSPFNPFGCPGLQHGEHTSKNWGCLRLSMYRLGWLLLILILIPIAIPVGLVIAGKPYIKLRPYPANRLHKKLVVVLLPKRLREMLDLGNPDFGGIDPQPVYLAGPPHLLGAAGSQVSGPILPSTQRDRGGIGPASARPSHLRETQRMICITYGSLYVQQRHRQPSMQQLCSLLPE